LKFARKVKFKFCLFIKLNTTKIFLFFSTTSMVSTAYFCNRFKDFHEMHYLWQLNHGLLRGTYNRFSVIHQVYLKQKTFLILILEFINRLKYNRKMNSRIRNVLEILILWRIIRIIILCALAKLQQQKNISQN
jgi:hypothetical protein